MTNSTQIEEAVGHIKPELLYPACRYSGEVTLEVMAPSENNGESYGDGEPQMRNSIRLKVMCWWSCKSIHDSTRLTCSLPLSHTTVGAQKNCC